MSHDQELKLIGIFFTKLWVASLYLDQTFCQTGSIMVNHIRMMSA